MSDHPSDTEVEDLSILKELNRFMWGSGDYEAVAALVLKDALALVHDAEVEAGQRVLDVATGTGNVAVEAARTGADVTGLDLTPEHFEVARRRAAEAGVTVAWTEGDAEALPFPDDSFDRVFSTFGSQFAPRHDLVASELLRVCRPGGTVGLCNWTSEGWTGRFTEITARYFPPAPAHVMPSMDWGDEEYVRGLFEPLGGAVEIERRRADYRFPDVDALMRFFSANFGPWLLARQSITPAERWHELYADLRAMTAAFDEGTTDTLVRPEYIRVLVRKPAAGA
ncbi:class I SAM-dependent methyltransferase [Kitasatospora saccharophila]|uniref:Class I SAM-dependent methyltransferase n=1 Tax=Kitasatospora saccharophila TaxID=407973 RepID=A0ABN2X9X7_9ACTN